MIEIHKKDKLIRKILPDQKLHSDAVYVLSQFVLSRAIDDSMVLFSTLTKQCYILPSGHTFDKPFAASEILSDPINHQLVKDHFLVPQGSDECGFYNKFSYIARAFRKSSGYYSYTILPTFACNARCVYCYEQGTAPASMTLETADQTAEFILKTRKKAQKISIVWFGGEPLLRPDIIDRICERLRNEAVEFDSLMISNGSLITDEIVQKMKRNWNLDYIQISMDGAEDDYRQRKNYYKYDNTYNAVMRGIGLMADAGISITVRLNIDYDNIDSINEVLEDLSAEIGNKEKVAVQLAPLYGVRTSENDLELWKKAIELSPIISEHGFIAGRLADADRVFRVFKCMADDYTGNVLIMPDGKLSPCQHCPEESIFGNIWDGVTEPDRLRRFTASDQTREKCRSCVFLPDCTSFANCPVQDRHCKEMRMMKAQLMIESMYKKAMGSNSSDTAEEPEEDALSHITTSD